MNYEEIWKKASKEVAKERDQYKAERDTLIDDIAVLKANISRLEREKEKYDKQFTDYIDETNVSLNLLSEISQHIGHKPSSSTYKYFRGKLNALEIREGE